MLKKVVFKNFKSFKNETVIDFTAKKYEILKEYNAKNNVLKGGIFYGSNASGKTGALNSVTILLDLLFKEFNFIPYFSCLFSRDTTTWFEYTFDIEKNIVKYFMEFDKNGKVFREKLLLNDKEYLARLGTSASSELTENKVYSSEDVDENTLFLRKIYFNTKFSEFPVLSKWMDFLKNSLFMDCSKVVTFNVQTQNEIKLEKYLEQHGVDEINNFYKKFSIPFEIEYKKNTNLQPLNILTNVIFKNKKTNIGVPFFMESNGNQTLLLILPNIITFLKTGGMLVIDEFSNGLHSKLGELLIDYVYKTGSNVQLLVASHQTNLMKTSLFRPDQVFIIDYDENGSNIHKASDASPRESQNLEKMYLAGVFGGIPLYEDSDK